MNAATMPHRPDPVKPRPFPRRIIFVRQHFTRFGGAELILDRTISAMHRRGVPLALLGRSWRARDDIEFIRCDPPRFPRFLRERKFADAACRRIAGERDALVQSHERIPCCDIFRAGDGVHAAYLERRMQGASAVARAALALHPFHRSVLALERELFASPRLKAVIVNSQMVADEVERHFGFPAARIHLIPNGIELARFHPDARSRLRNATRARLGTDRQRPAILFVGSGYKRKGLDAAIAALAAGRSDAELWVVGSDSRPAAYAAKAGRLGIPASRLRLIGPVDDPLPYYAAADALILPSIYDPFPSTVIEALACGLPVVTSTGCGARDTVAQLDPRLVRDTADVAGFSEAIGIALDLAARPDTIGRTHSIAGGYDVEQMAERMLMLYSELTVGATA
ncbi:MAG: glycosyltransferase family 4 protein [Bradyrhizobiaceae bacterium]|nr:glycosyltransferase family 4 protein [Bradyrhizobiaceae bacterium]